MNFSILASAIIMTIIIALRYLVSSGFFAWLTQQKFPALYQKLGRQMRREIYWSLLSAGIYGVPAGIVAWGWQNLGWTFIYQDISDYPLWYLPISLFLYLFAHDTYFYWTHRAMHIPKLFKIAHAVHHESRPPTAWAAMSFHPIEAFSGALFLPFMVFILPVHISVLGIILTIMTFMGIANHMGWEIFPKWIVHGRLGKCMITATHHQKHHDIYRGNYGLYFRFWDKICGTDVGLGTLRHGGDAA
ncbi:sterol desaturase [Sphingorhabdus lutea]|uniref:Sterol desaturase n=1 Tax=Sphingorhabdus lutea TaxID=1913578 RepID=A0A1L3J941_9SPHN|nr:sterol desaturase family protein [Sphingorhabdus lutea]APG61630.1 sterol desaturase [Sphingorhabdus lutea]